MDLEPGRKIDRYVVEGLLGQGGMAAVYRVRHEQLGTPYALKVLTIPAKSIQKRLLQEGRVQASLRHPNVVTVTDVIEVDGAPGLVMELVAGPSLDAFLQGTALTLEQIDALGRGILEGVAAAHEAGLIHRDLKPGNVLLEIRGGDLIPKITDFGLAKVLDNDESGAGMTRSGLAMGTPAYMAPEQIRNAKHVDHRADVFSLGCVLYELLTTRRAFEGEDTFEVFSQVTSGRYRPVSELRPDAPERMQRAVVGALEVDREQRIADVRELLRVWSADAPRAEAVGPWSREALHRATEMGSGGSSVPPPSPAPASSGADATVDFAGLPSYAGSIAAVEASEPAAVPRPSQRSLPSQPAQRSQPSLPSRPPPSLTSQPPPDAGGRAGVAMLLGGGLMGVGLVALAGALVVVALVAGIAMIGAPEPLEPVAVAPAPISAPPVAADPDPARSDPGRPGPARPDAARPEAGRPEAGRPDPARPEPTRPAPVRPAPADPAPVPQPAAPPAAEPPAEAAPPDAPGDADGPGEPAPEEPADTDAPPDTDPPEPPATATGLVTHRIAMHPMMKAAESVGEVWLERDGKRYEMGEVPVGDYRVMGLLGLNVKGDPIILARVTVEQGRTHDVTCYVTLQECKVK